MAEIVAATGASEVEVARRCLRLGLAETTVAVVERLGCAPEGTLAVRVRLAADRAASAVWVLVIDGARGSQRARALDRPGAPTAYRHVSIHADDGDAEDTIDRVLREHLRRGGALEEIRVTVAERTVAERTVGHTRRDPPAEVEVAPGGDDEPPL